MAPEVETQTGWIEGIDRGGHLAFRGIPFAAPPIADRRFATPGPVTPWTGRRDCSEFAAACPQPPSPLPGMAPGPQDEDCLYLNVYTPRCDAGRRPVLFWIHGGAFRTGSGSQALYEGRALVERGDVVLVTINYRLGPLGYMSLRDAPANLGQLDQIQALEWTRDNISAFGGDPDQVTIFGESAGGMAVTTLLAMPAARGLFRRAVSQSGAAQATLSVDRAERVRFEFERALGMEDADLSRLRNVPCQTLVDASTKTNDKLNGEIFLPFAPSIDEASLPLHPLAAVRAGQADGIDLMVGTTRDEFRLFTFAIRQHRSLDLDTVAKKMSARLRDTGVGNPQEAAADLLHTYARDGRAPWEVFDAIETDRRFRLPALQLLEAQAPHRTSNFGYLFCWPSPAGRGLLGACHALELPFVFGTLDAPTMDRFAGRGPEAEKLSHQMMDAWVHFARHGRPDHPSLPSWKRHDGSDRATLLFDREPRLEHDPFAAERRVWDGIL